MKMNINYQKKTVEKREETGKREEIKKLVQHGKMLQLKDREGKLYLYYDKLRLLIPVKQTITEYGFDSDINSKLLSYPINGHKVNDALIIDRHAVEVFSILARIKEFDSWGIEAGLWVVDNTSLKGSEHMIYNAWKHQVLKMRDEQKGYILRVIYLEGKKVYDDNSNTVNMELLDKYGLDLVKTSLTYRDRQSSNSSPLYNSKNNIQDAYSNLDDEIKRLLDCDKIRCGLPAYEIEKLYDIKAGHWDVFENTVLGEKSDNKLVPRDPVKDIKKNGIIGIDFGTKSTVVVKQEGRNEIRPIRIGTLSLDTSVSENDFENPTIISCMNINRFLEKYCEKVGRPETSCDDLFVSYNAYEAYKNCPTEDFYAYYSDIKQWANREKEDVVVQDTKERAEYHFADVCSKEEKKLNPIEVYAYYIGMYINNMRNGVYLRYIMSFPVKYSKETKELIRKSFENGLRKSLPTTIVENKELMSGFSVEYQISEPAAYAVTALEQKGYKPKDENEKYLYGIFDFGGGTTDFDFGVWRGASDAEYDKFNCDYVLECFGADSDVRLGGENILEMLAYQVFKNNRTLAAEKRIACALPVNQIEFIGGENLLNNSQSANRNLTLLKEALRPLWEQHENWVQEYKQEDDDGEYIEIQMYNFEGEAVPNCRFAIDTNQLLEMIKDRIQVGVDAFFKCIEKSILENKVAQSASEKVYIFLAGNSCKSIFVKDIFEKTIELYDDEYGRIETQATDEQMHLEEKNALYSLSRWQILKWMSIMCRMQKQVLHMGW